MTAHWFDNLWPGKLAICTAKHDMELPFCYLDESLPSVSLYMTLIDSNGLIVSFIACINLRKKD